MRSELYQDAYDDYKQNPPKTNWLKESNDDWKDELACDSSDRDDYDVSNSDFIWYTGDITICIRKKEMVSIQR